MVTAGRYQFIRRIAAGGMAEVWKAKVEGAAGFEKILAIKRILPHLAESQEFVRLFIDEAKLVASLVHPNIVGVFDFGELEGGAYFLAMEYVPGTNLSKLIERLHDVGARLPLEVALYIGIEACKALGYAHSRPQPIIHRDVSPHNLLVSFDGEVKVTDFGIAKVQGAVTSTDTGYVRGKLAYMSPEQANMGEVDHRCDLFSLGVSLYRLILGEKLFKGVAQPELYASVATFKGPPAEKLEPLPYSIREILTAALEPDPENRYQTAAEMESDLTAALGDSTVVTRQTLGALIKRQFAAELAAEDEEPEPEPKGSFAGRGDTVISTSPLQGTATSSSGPVSAGVILEKTSSTPVPPPPKEPSSPEVEVVEEHTGGTKSIKASVPPPPSTKRRGRWVLPVTALLVAFIAAAGWLGRRWITDAGAGASTTATSTEVARATTAATEQSTPTPVRDTPTPTPRQTPTPRRTVSRTPRATPQPTPVAVTRYGTLSVQARPWAEVWVDGQRLSRETPVHERVTAGRHTVTVVHPSGFRASQTVVVPAAGEVELFANVSRKTFRVKN